MENKRKHVMGKSDPTDSMDYDHLPVQRPPRTKKNEIFKPTDYEYLDNHVKQVGISHMTKSLRSLVATLIQPAQSDVGRLRAIFLWLASVDLATVKYPPTAPPIDSVIGYLIRLKDRKSNHATLFYNLCKEAKIPCVKISGLSKNSRYQVGGELDPSRLKSQWNAVVIDGQWRLIDVFWASTAAKKKSANQVDGLNSVRADDEGGTETTDHGVNEFFFMTDPEAFIYTHLPDDSKWQFLAAKKIAPKEFEMLPYLRERFFDMKLFISEDSHVRCVLETFDEEIFLQFGLDPSCSETAEFRYMLQKGKASGDKDKSMAFDGSGNRIAGTSKEVLKKAVSLTKYPDELRLNLHLPVFGRYRLDVFGRDRQHPNLSEHDILCSYIIDYKQASTAYLEVHFLFATPSDHARFLRRGGASDWLKRKEATLKVAGGELVISFAMPPGPDNGKRFLMDFDNRHQLVPPAIRSLLHIVPKEFNLIEAHDARSGRKEWNAGKIKATFLSHANGLVRTPNGRADISLTINTGSEIWYEFHEDHHTKTVPKEGIKLTMKTEGDTSRITFAISVKKPMEYLLNVFARNKAELNKFFHLKTYCVQYELLELV